MADSEALNPYAPPQHEAQAVPEKLTGAYFDGKLLTFNKGGMLPNVCLKCAAASPIVRRKQVFSYTPPWVLFLFLFCNLVGLIAMAIVTKRAIAQLPLCPACNQRWRSAKIAILATGLSFLSPFLVIYLAPKTYTGGAIILPLLSLSLVAFIVAIVVYARPRMLRAKKIDDISITLAGVDPRAAQAVVSAGTGMVV